MTKKEKKEINEKINMEGFDYAIHEYADEVKDKKFHELRKAYLKAEKELKEYIDCTE